MYLDQYEPGKPRGARHFQHFPNRHAYICVDCTGTVHNMQESRMKAPSLILKAEGTGTNIWQLTGGVS